MIKKQKTKKPRKPLGVPQIVFMILNTALVMVILGFLGYRAWKYKNIFDEQYKEMSGESSVTLSEALAKKGITDVENFMSNEDGSYTFINDPKYNYISYSGRLFRALEINTDGNVKMVDMSIESIAIVVPNESFDQTALYAWLNGSGEEGDHTGYYLKSLDNYSEVLVNTNICTDKVDDVSQSSCTYYTADHFVGMLTFSDYNAMGGLESYVVTGESFWLQTGSEDGTFWFVNEQGAVSLGDHDTQFIGIRPVITMSGSTVVASGKGTAKHPYVVVAQEKEKVQDLNISNYVSYSGHLWRVVSKDDSGNVELLLDGYVLNSKGNPVKTVFGDSTVYNTKSGVGKYLNSTFLKTLENYKQVLVKHDWYYGPLKEAKGYDYRDGFTKSVKCYVGIPNTSYMYLNDYPNIFLANTVPKSKEFTFVLDEYNHLYQQLLTSKGAYMRPLICMKGDISLAAGTGSQGDPYILDLEAGGEAQ